jgi:outer membrane immunogenic protein
LLYVAGGVAFGDTKLALNSPLGNAAYSSTRTGYTVGGGIDYAFTNNWIGRVEYRYNDLGRTSISYLGVGDRVRNTSSQVIGALIYKFGAPESSVVAKY